MGALLKNPGKIERRFLVRGVLPPSAESASPPLHLGCLSAGGNREVFVGRIGKHRFLLVREGRGRFLRESEIRLVPRDFENLWKLTEGSRIQKKSRAASVNGLDFRLETIQCGDVVLRIAVLFFSNRAASLDFEPPDFLGLEITGFDEFTDAHLALHGVPPARNGRSQSGAMPFLFKNGILHLVLVTSSSGTRWIVPKGGLERGMTRQEVALMEAAEEAGAIGMLEPGIKAQCRMADGRVLHLHPLRVSVLLPHWPERTMRRRVVLPVYRALMRIRDPEVAQAIRQLGRRLEP